MPEAIDSELGIVMMYLPPNKRSHPADIIRLCYPGTAYKDNNCWVASLREVKSFYQALGLFIEGVEAYESE